MQADTPENVEQIVTSVWKEVLRAEVIRRDDDFLHLGGASILAELIAARLQEVLDVELTGSDVLRYPTIAQLSAQIGTALVNPTPPDPPPVDE